ncbi:MAG TPA: hypothetical protein DEP72_01565 [Clostridiales bacterium]|nr:MAG: hypothetical protein A2Y18_07480 [Clostridiales bacterium GWD2_32_19]HCC06841.1 hypothetical protein [Clostridiales bacterium]
MQDKQIDPNLKLSIVVENHNNGVHIDDTLKSIINNVSDEYNYETIVVDYNSTDDSKNDVHKYTKGISNNKTICLKENESSLGKGLNEAVKAAKGEKILFLGPGSELTNNINGLIEEADSTKALVTIGGILYSDGEQPYGSDELMNKTSENTNAVQTTEIFGRSSHEGILFDTEFISENIRFPEIGAVDNFAGVFPAYYMAENKIRIACEPVEIIKKSIDVRKYKKNLGLFGWLADIKYENAVLKENGKEFAPKAWSRYIRTMLGQLGQNIGYAAKSIWNGDEQKEVELDSMLPWSGNDETREAIEVRGILDNSQDYGYMGETEFVKNYNIGDKKLESQFSEVEEAQSI